MSDEDEMDTESSDFESEEEVVIADLKQLWKYLVFPQKRQRLLGNGLLLASKEKEEKHYLLPNA